MKTHKVHYYSKKNGEGCYVFTKRSMYIPTRADIKLVTCKICLNKMRRKP